MNPALHQSIPSQNEREIRLLLLCAGRSLGRETAEQIKSLSNADIDWHYLLKIASLHKLQFLLYQSLKNVCPESVPDGILKQLETRYLRNVAYSLRITRQLFEIIDFLDDHGIQSMPFKGPVLSELAYGDLTLRPSELVRLLDLDLTEGRVCRTNQWTNADGERSEPIACALTGAATAEVGSPLLRSPVIVPPVWNAWVASRCRARPRCVVSGPMCPMRSCAPPHINSHTVLAPKATY